MPSLFSFKRNESKCSLNKQDSSLGTIVNDPTRLNSVDSLNKDSSVVKERSIAQKKVNQPKSFERIREAPKPTHLLHSQSRILESFGLKSKVFNTDATPHHDQVKTANNALSTSALSKL